MTFSTTFRTVEFVAQGIEGDPTYVGIFVRGTLVGHVDLYEPYVVAPDTDSEVLVCCVLHGREGVIRADRYDMVPWGMVAA